MTPEKKAKAKMNQAEKSGRKPSLNRYYEYPPSEPRLNLACTKYANGFTGNVSTEDVFIDFIELPGRKVDGIQTVEGCRIYFTHNNARALYDLLGEIIEEIESICDETGEKEKENLHTPN